MEEEIREQGKREERNHFVTTHDYRNLKGVHREGWLKEKSTREVTREGKGVDKGMYGKRETEILLPLRKFVIEVLERGGKRGGGEGGITEEENDLGTQAISHRESRPDTTASIIQMTTANERDPNKSPLNLLGEH